MQKFIRTVTCIFMTKQDSIRATTCANGKFVQKERHQLWIVMPLLMHYRNSFYQPAKCTGRLVIKGNADDNGRMSQVHSHLPDNRSLGKAKVLNTIKSAAKNEKASARSLVQND